MNVTNKTATVAEVDTHTIDGFSAPSARLATAQKKSRASIALPIILSSIASGLWMRLAFMPRLSFRAGFLVSLVLASLFACMFALPVVTTKPFALRRELARCSFAAVVFVLFLPEYMGRLVPPWQRSALLLAIVILLWLCLCAACRSSKLKASQTKPSLWNRANRLGALGLLLLFGVTTALALRKYTVFGYVGQDLAYFGQIMHTTLEGHLFWGNLLQDLIYSKPVSTDFAGHNSPIMFLALPFYALAPSPVALLILRNVVLFTCAWPILLIAHRRVSLAASWLWVGAFFLTPAILQQTVFDFYPLTFVALPLLLSLHFYLERRYVAFCIAMVFTLLVREDMVFFVFGMGLLALLQRFMASVPRRNWVPWVVVPVSLATAWAAVSFFVVLPTALHGATFVTDACFAHLGSDRSQMLHNVLYHSRENVLVHGNLVYLKTLFTPTALILAAASPVAFLSLPFLAINLLAGAGRCITTVISAQYSVVPATLLFAGALLSMTARHSTNKFARVGRLGLQNDAASPLLLLALGAASLVFVTDQVEIKGFRSQPWNMEARYVLSLVPAGASVAAPRYMLPHMANRDCLYQTHRLLQYHTPVYEYIILDTDWNHINAAEDYRQQYAEVARRTAADPAWQTIYASRQYRVYRDPARGGQQCDALHPVLHASQSLTALESQPSLHDHD